jgi:alkylation response protein AidB-like acyl-CoA dehydrogenase
MEFSINNETKMLQSSAEKFLKAKSPMSLVKDMIKQQIGFSEEIWRDMADLGWLGLIYDEKYGGSGGSFFDLFILFEEIGKVLLPSPLLCSAVFAGLLIDEAGNENMKKEYLPSIIQGKRLLTVGLRNEQGHYDHTNPELKAEEVAIGSYMIKGTRVLVPYAHVADEILVCANLKGKEVSGSTLFKIDGKISGLKKTPLNIITGEKTFGLVFENIKVSKKDIVGSIGQGALYVDKVLPKVITLKCGEMIGGLSRVLSMTVDYVKQRIQFGRPLGALQVVQHYCADMATFLDTSRMIAYQAAFLLSERIPCTKEVAMAKAWCSDVYKRCTQIAHQLHGGIGFTEEHDLHLYYKHAKVSELDFGDSRYHRQIIGEAMGF